MTYETTTRRETDGWQALSEVVIGETREGKRILKLITSKEFEGINSCVQVCLRSGEGTETSKLPGDYYKRSVAFAPCRRVTEKVLRQAHDIALSKLPVIIDCAKAYYEAQVSEQEAA